MAGNAERLALVASGAVRITATFEQAEAAAHAAAAAAPPVGGFYGKPRPREYRGWSRDNPGPLQREARAREAAEKRDSVYLAAVSGDSEAARKVLSWECSRMRGGYHEMTECVPVPAGGVLEVYRDVDHERGIAAGHPVPLLPWVPGACRAGAPLITTKGKGESVTPTEEKTARTKRARAAAAAASSAGDSPEAVRMAASEAYRAELPASVPAPVAAPAAAAAVGPAGNGGNVGEWLNMNRVGLDPVRAPARDIAREAFAALEAGRLDAESRAEAAAEKRGRKPARAAVAAPVAAPVAAAPADVPASVPGPVVIPSAPGIVPNAAPVVAPELGGAVRF
jgi:hypothetical protein